MFTCHNVAFFHCEEGGWADCVKVERGMAIYLEVWSVVY